MALIEWDDKYSVNIESIDEQHKVLVKMINEFYENIKDKSTNALISDLINEMKKYTVFHFNKEEFLFQKHGFPGYKAHKKEHDDFVNKVIDLEKRFNDGKLIISFEVTNFLKSWLLNHIQGTDKEYSEFLRKKGVK